MPNGTEFTHLAQLADVVVVTVPFSAQQPTLESIRDFVQGKVLIDVTVPLVPPKVARVQMPEEGSAGQIAQAFLGEDVRVVSAFQNVAAAHLQTDDPIACDVLVCIQEQLSWWKTVGHPHFGLPHKKLG